MTNDKIIHAQNKRVIRPIRNQKDIERIRSIIYDEPRNLLLFDLATQTGLEMKKLLTLRVRHLLGYKLEDHIHIEENETGLEYTIVMNNIIYETFQRYIGKIKPKPNDYLFKSRKGDKPLNLSSISNMIKGWYERAGIKGLHGAKSLQKTWEYSIRANSLVKENPSQRIGDFSTIDPIKKETIQDKVYSRILDAIVMGKITPGMKLTSSQLSKHFAVSPIPVKIALSKLEAKGLVESLGKKGLMVRKLSKDSLIEINRIRLALEKLAIKESCKIITEKTIRKLEFLLSESNKTKSIENLRHINKEFHLTYYRDANMPILMDLLEGLLEKLSPYFLYNVARAESIELFLKESNMNHRGILDGFRQRDPNEVIRWLKVDLSYANSQIDTYLEDANKLKPEKLEL